MKSKTSWVLAVAGALTFIAAPAFGATNEPDGRGPFADVDGSIHEMDIAALHAAGITSGCAEWLFCPDDDVTRAQMAAFLNRALELPPAESATFDDTSESRFAEDIAAIAAADITVGCRAGEYCPDEPVTRGQMASLLVRALELPMAEGDPFHDDDGNVHEEDIAAIAVAGITYGCGDGRFCPDEPVTRAQMASFLVRALGLEPPAELPAIPTDVIDELNRLTCRPVTRRGWRPLVEVLRARRRRSGDSVMACESNGDPKANRSSGRQPLPAPPGAWAKGPPGRVSRASMPGPGEHAAAAHLLYGPAGGSTGYASDHR